LLVPRLQVADLLNLEGESTLRLVGAEEKEDGRAGKDCELRPDRQKSLMSAQERSGTSIWARPRDITVQIDRQAIAQGGTGLEHSLHSHCW
jgi:hypothetical protein